MFISHLSRRIKNKQRGAALMVMLVIMVLGVASLLVATLSGTALKTARDSTTASALAQAKDALIGRAATDPNMPGSLPCPDIDGNGTSDGTAGICTNNIGRLPWKTLGLPDLRDGSGESLWYTLSSNFRDNPSSSPLNSESNGLLNVTSGTQTQNGIIAIVFAPGNALPGQDRSSTATTASCTITGIATPTNNLCFANYLEGSNAAALPNLNFQSTATGIAFNDQLLTITSDQLFPSVEMRLARETKGCLDDYATTNGNKYPWAAPAGNFLSTGTTNTLFGRMPSIDLATNDSKVTDMLNALNALQTAVNNCILDSGNGNALDNAGSSLENAAKIVRNNQPTSPAMSSSITSPAVTAGDKAQDNWRCADINTNPTNNVVQTNLNSAYSAITSTFPFCPLVSLPYWTDWRNQVFYQVDNQYRPGGSMGPPTLTINGNGNYRAVVLVARNPINQVRNPSTPNTYLEGSNVHTNPNPSTAFTSNSVSSPAFKTANDLVICLDGKVSCK